MDGVMRSLLFIILLIAPSSLSFCPTTNAASNELFLQPLVPQNSRKTLSNNGHLGNYHRHGSIGNRHPSMVVLLSTTLKADPLPGRRRARQRERQNIYDDDYVSATHHRSTTTATKIPEETYFQQFCSNGAHPQNQRHHQQPQEQEQEQDDSQDSIDQMVWQAEMDLNHAIMTHDILMLDQLLDEDLISVNHFNEVLTKVDFLKYWLEHSDLLEMEWISFQIVPSKNPSVSDQMVVGVSIDAQIIGEVAGEYMEECIRFRRVWKRKRSGRWQVIQGDSSLVIV